MKKFISYYRVSTAKQGQSGLGLEAQQAAVEAFAASNGGEIVRSYTEVESGKRNDRPQLAAALAHARLARATLVVAKLDRLARSASFLLAVIEGGADVAFCDFPTIPPGPAGKMMLTQMASFAEYEAGMISHRTKSALKAAKARGVALGSARLECRHNLSRDAMAEGRRLGAEAAKAKAAAAYEVVLPMVREMHSAGVGLRRIAERLNAESYTTRTGRPWTHTQVGRVLERAGA